MNKFYSNRKGHKYYKTVREWLESYGPRGSILDIGSADAPVASWGTFGCRYSIDPRFELDIEHVASVKGSWPEDKLLVPPRVEVITCLQVIEHVDDVQPFVAAIFATATHRVVLSVPFMWRAGLAPGHVHDPISRKKLHGWTKREPIRSLVVTDRGVDRLIEEYEP